MKRLIKEAFNSDLYGNDTVDVTWMRHLMELQQQVQTIQQNLVPLTISAGATTGTFNVPFLQR